MMSTRSPPKPRMTGRLAPGPKLRLATPGSCSSGLADGGGEPRLAISQRVDGRHRIEGLQRRGGPDRRRRGDRHLLAHRREVEREVDGGRVSPPTMTVTVRLAGGEPIALRGHLVGAGRHVRESRTRPSSVRANAPVPRIRITAPSTEAAVLHQRHGAPHRARFLRPEPPMRPGASPATGRRAGGDNPNRRPAGVRSCLRARSLPRIRRGGPPRSASHSECHVRACTE